jgi:hypothetical protein
MNDLSWFLYLADVLPRVGSFAGGLSGFLVVVTVGTLFMVAMVNAEPSFKKLGYPWKTIVVALVSALIFGVSSALIPSKETIYLIAGSEAGEAVVTSEAGQEILDDIHQVIKHQLNSLKGE